MIKKAIRVEGMTCAMCAKTIENTFKDNANVDVKVNVGAGKVLVNYDESHIKLTDIAEQINQSGYHVVLEETLADNAKLRKKMLREIIVSVTLSIPLLWAMFSHIPIFSFLYVPPLFTQGFFQLVTSGIVQFFIGKRFYIGAYNAIKKRVLGMDILVVLGTTSAFLYSLYLLIQHTWVMPMHHPEYYFEISALIITMVLLGNYFEHKAKERTTDALVELLNLGAKEARIVQGEKTTMVPIESVKVGDILLVKANEKIPIDGVLVEGKTHIDESMITGESIPVNKKVNDKVIGATMNVQETIKIRAEKVGSDTMLNQIISTVEEASAAKLPIQRTADKVASVFVPFVISIALLNFAVHWVFLDFSFAASFTRSIAILVISCPCALGLATPTSILVGNGKAAQNHILYKGGEFFELAPKIQVIAFDKTGTLTLGKPTVTDYLGTDDALLYAMSVENQSTHPISQALVSYAESKTLTPLDVTDFKTLEGKGIKGTINSQEVVIGSYKLMQLIDIELGDWQNAYNTWIEAAKTTNFIVIDNQVKGLYAVRDDIKPSSKRVIEIMKAKGLETVMITGDHEKVARAIANEVGISTYFSGVLPHEKAEIIQKLQAEGKVVAFVGDGINDAPALKIADVGIAMGYGTDVAIDSSDVTLMSHDLGLVIKAIEMSKATLKNIHQNFFWAFSYNLVAIPLAATGRLSMVLAAAAMGFSSIMVVMNALRLKTTKLTDVNTLHDSEIKEGKTMKLQIPDMSCNHCLQAISKTLKQKGVNDFSVDLDTKSVTINDVNSVQSDIVQWIQEAGYTVQL